MTAVNHRDTRRSKLLHPCREPHALGRSPAYLPMNPLTRSPVSLRPKLLASAPYFNKPHLTPRVRSPFDVGETPFSWVLVDSVAAVAPPPQEAAPSAWLSNLRQQGISVLVSLNEPSRVADEALARFRIHPIVCPLPAQGIPPLGTVLALCGGLLRLLRQGEKVAVCCDERMERTALLLSMLLLWIGRPLHEATQLLGYLCGQQELSIQQERFLLECQAALAQVELAGLTCRASWRACP